ncbi:hypothetical protein D5R40_17595 [Okeania hirsuta]|uniref:Uncharacterized protein n=1 Tax=Okeania hirsuta TaxID=1458930 RepID=A0A3N6P0T8_9CYAN|nr:hypothetical protein D4Z78_01905 [Okeania hirsuta]RQH38958.1 hypothetical protein D5R40_17595 [Okeania hirsuta]
MKGVSPQESVGKKKQEEKKVFDCVCVAFCRKAEQSSMALLNNMILLRQQVIKKPIANSFRAGQNFRRW